MKLFTSKNSEVMMMHGALGKISLSLGSTSLNVTYVILTKEGKVVHVLN
jgi:hypothetical protein